MTQGELVGTGSARVNVHVCPAVTGQYSYLIHLENACGAAPSKTVEVKFVAKSPLLEIVAVECGSGSAPAEVWEATTKTFLAPLGRPLDLHLSGGRVYVLEYTRPTDFRSGRGWLPGRILEVEPSGP
jgi:hypothetical protein